jgi:hypothetical protein
LKLNGRDWGFIGAAVVVVGALVALSLIARKPVPMSDGAYHVGLTKTSKRADCMVCHDPNKPDASNPLKAEHPLVWRKEDVACTVCHVPSTQVASADWSPPRARVRTLSSTVQFCFTSR